MAKKIAVLGNGYVGLLAAVGLADFGNTCIGADVNPDKIAALSAGRSPLYEPGIEEYLNRNLSSGRLRFTTDLAEAIQESEVLFITVGTPSLEDGGADLTFVGQVADIIARNLNSYKVVVIKSTVPVGTNRWVRDRIAQAAGAVPGKDFDLVSNPEFLREGRAVQDFFHPDRTVIGYESDRAREVMFEVYRALNVRSVPFVWCSLETAELIKYASNTFLATKIAFINEMANLAEAVGADIHTIAQSMGMDGRISPKFLHPGPGFGGSCFPKDTRALEAAGRQFGVNMSIAKAVDASNEAQKQRTGLKLARLLGRTLDPGSLGGLQIGVLGLAFKQETDDIRESPALVLVRQLLDAGAQVRAYDPKAAPNFAREFPEVTYYEGAYEAAAGADALVIMTEWNEFRGLDLARLARAMKGRVLVDGRNLLDPAEARAVGFTYEGVGRGQPVGRGTVQGSSPL